jgi:hypothetical protein
MQQVGAGCRLRRDDDHGAIKISGHGAKATARVAATEFIASVTNGNQAVLVVEFNMISGQGTGQPARKVKTEQTTVGSAGCTMIGVCLDDQCLDCHCLLNNSLLV